MYVIYSDTHKIGQSSKPSMEAQLKDHRGITTLFLQMKTLDVQIFVLYK